MSKNPDKDDNGLIIVNNGRFLPPHWADQLPGVDPQKKRSHHLKHKHLTPLSFHNVVFSGCFKIGIMFWLCWGIKTFLRGFITAYFGYILLSVFVILILLVLYGQTIVKNAPDLQEELLFNGVSNVLFFIAGFVIAVL